MLLAPLVVAWVFQHIHRSDTYAHPCARSVRRHSTVAAVPLHICRGIDSLRGRPCHCCTSCMSLCYWRRFSYQLAATAQALCTQQRAADVCKLAQQCFRTHPVYLVLLPSSATLSDHVASPKAQQSRHFCLCVELLDLTPTPACCMACAECSQSSASASHRPSQRSKQLAVIEPFTPCDQHTIQLTLPRHFAPGWPTDLLSGGQIAVHPSRHRMKRRNSTMQDNDIR